MGVENERRERSRNNRSNWFQSIQLPWGSFQFYACQRLTPLVCWAPLPLGIMTLLRLQSVVGCSSAVLLGSFSVRAGKPRPTDFIKVKQKYGILGRKGTHHHFVCPHYLNSGGCSGWHIYIRCFTCKRDSIQHASWCANRLLGHLKSWTSTS